MSDWSKIKNNISELEGNNKLSPLDKKPLDNELVMCLFCNICFFSSLVSSAMNV